MNHKYVALIRFNTEFPSKGRKWRILDEEGKDEIQVDEIVSEGCLLTTSTDALPSGEIKHHVRIHHDKLIIINHVANFVKQR